MEQLLDGVGGLLGRWDLPNPKRASLSI